MNEYNKFQIRSIKYQISNTIYQLRSGIVLASNHMPSLVEINNKFEITISKLLKIEDWNLFGACNFEFVIF